MKKNLTGYSSLMRMKHKITLYKHGRSETADLSPALFLLGKLITVTVVIEEAGEIF